MMQGEHIIDIVNSYLGVALNSGLVGLGMFLGFFATIGIGLLRALKSKVGRDPEFGTYARASLAILAAMMVTIATVSSIDFIPYIYWSCAGLCVALVRIGYRERARVVSSAPGRLLAPGHRARFSDRIDAHRQMHGH